jgi:SET domain-containing protein
MESILDIQTLNSYISSYSSTTVTDNNGNNNNNSGRSTSHNVSPSSLAAAGLQFFEAPNKVSAKVSTPCQLYSPYEYFVRGGNIQV